MFKHFGTLARLIIFVFIAFFCLIAALFLGSILTLVYSSGLGIDVSSVNSDAGFLRVYQSITSVVLFVVPALLYSFMFDNSLREGLFFKQSVSFYIFLLALLVIILALPFTGFLNSLNSRLVLPNGLQSIENWMRLREDRAKEITDTILITKSFAIYLINVVVMALIPAVCEELLFRATLQKILYNWFNPIVAALITSVLFSAFHLQFYGFLPRLFLGFILGFLLVCTKNILVPMAAHFFNNFVATTAYYVCGHDLDVLEKNNNDIFYTILVVISVVVLFVLCYKWRKSALEEF